MMVADLAKATTTDQHPNGFKWSPYKGLVDRETNELVSSNLDEIAKILLNPNAKGSDLGSVESIVKANPDAKKIVTRYETDPTANPNWNDKKIQPKESLADRQLNRIVTLASTLVR